MKSVRIVLLLAALPLTVVAQSTPTLTASPAALTFSYQIGATTLPLAQSVQIQSSPAGLNFSAAISGTAFNGAWLLASASTGKAPFTMKIQVNPTGLPAGSYAGTVTLTAVSGTTTLTATVAVTLLVSVAPPTISSSPTALNFSYVTGTPIPAPALTNVFVISSNGAPLSATLAVTGAPWLKIAPTGNISLVGLFNSISVTVDPTGLAPKVYSAVIKIAAPNSVNKSISVNVTLTVNAAPPTITAVWPAGVLQGSAAEVITLVGTNFFSTSTVAATGITSEAKITLTDGTTTVATPFLIPVYPAAASQVRLTMASPLPAGVAGTAYTQSLSATGGTGPYTYTLYSGILPPGLGIASGTLTGTPSAAGTYTFSLRAEDTVNVFAYQEFQLTVSPSGSPGLRIIGAALPAGTVAAAYAPVTLTAAGGTGGPYTWTATGLPAGLVLSSAGVLSGTPTTEGLTANLTASVVSDTAMLVTVPASLQASAGTLRMAVTTPAPGGGTSNEAPLRVYGPGPQVLAVVNSGSYRQGVIAPGDIINIFGLGLGPATLTIFDPSVPPIPTSLPAAAPSTSVTINGTPAPLLYTSATQVAAIVPYSLSGASAQVTVTYGGLTSTPFTTSTATADPGVFTMASSGVGQGAILNYSATAFDYSINSAANPAARGSTIVLYVTGAGQTTSAVYNQLIPASPAVTPLLAPLVQIGGQAATITGAQAPMGSVPGLIQLNVIVPSTLSANPATPVVVTFGGIPSQSGVTMAVK